MRTKPQPQGQCKCGHFDKDHLHEFYGKGKRGKNVNDWVCRVCGCEDFKRMKKRGRNDN